MNEAVNRVKDYAKKVRRWRKSKVERGEMQASRRATHVRLVGHFEGNGCGLIQRSLHSNFVVNRGVESS